MIDFPVLPRRAERLVIGGVLATVREVIHRWAAAGAEVDLFVEVDGPALPKASATRDRPLRDAAMVVVGHRQTIGNLRDAARYRDHAVLDEYVAAVDALVDLILED
ncbi:MAG: hypothetical protein KGS10_16175 [Chloroflexi bacterium]|nr:hypothetical protein [Chloroflexota bacterium]